MIVFRYDRTFEGLLTAVFDAYVRRTFPEALIGPDEPGTLFGGQMHRVVSDPAAADRVWKGLLCRIPAKACNMILHAWLSEIPGTDGLLLRYMRMIFDRASAAADIADPVATEIRKRANKTYREAGHLVQFTRLRRAADGTWFAPVAPQHNALPLTMHYFTSRFADQRWLIYDLRRHYGYYYDTEKVVEATLPDEGRFAAAMSDESMLDADECRFQELWKTYFDSVAIGQRLNRRLQKQFMPRRFWPYLTEM